MPRILRYVPSCCPALCPHRSQSFADIRSKGQAMGDHSRRTNRPRLEYREQRCLWLDCSVAPLVGVRSSDCGETRVSDQRRFGRSGIRNGASTRHGSFIDGEHQDCSAADYLGSGLWRQWFRSSNELFSRQERANGDVKVFSTNASARFDTTEERRKNHGVQCYPRAYLAWLVGCVTHASIRSLSRRH